MNDRRVGLWLIGAFGGVGTTAALGLAALRQKLTAGTGLVTELPQLQVLDLVPPSQFVIGGHDVRQADFAQTVREFQQRSNVFDQSLVEPCLEQLAEWSANVRPGTILNSGETIAQLADLPEAHVAETPRDALERIQTDINDFRSANQLEDVIVVNVASTEAPFATTETHNDLARLRGALARRSDQPLLPASSLYALAALELGLPYVNFTPSLGASFPAAIDLAREKRTVVAGQDGKTGETLMKTVLAPMFAQRNLRVLSWVGHNIFGNRDGQVLNDPRNKESKVRTKDQVITEILGYKPQTLVSIEYIESLDDWKTAWDHIHFQGFLGVKMTLQFTWQGCDSLLAAPLALDLARLAHFAHRQGEVGVLGHLACFFKNPMGTTEHDFFKQFAQLEAYAARHGGKAQQRPV